MSKNVVRRIVHTAVAVVAALGISVAVAPVSNASTCIGASYLSCHWR